MFISMDSKKHAFPEPFISQRRKVICGFGLGVGASLIIFSVLLFNRAVNVSRVHIFLQGFEGVRANSSFASFSFSYPPNLTSSSVGDHTGASEFQKPVNSGISRTRLENPSEYRGNKNLQVEEQSIQRKRHEDGALVAKRSDFSDSNGQGIGSAKIGEENSSKLVKDASLHGEGKGVTANASLSDEAIMVTQKTVDGKPPRNANFSTKNAARSNNAAGNYGGHSVEKNKNNVTVFYDGSQKKEQIDFKNCDLYDGKWVRDDSKPYYPFESCPYIDRDFDCHNNGRPDSEYVKWKWQPNGCLIPSLNATDFLERLRGRKLVFVGDSLNRNMWESLVCLLRQSIKHKKHVYEISGKSEFKKSGFYAFRFEDYNCSVDYVSSPFLVRESTFTGKNGTFETLRLDKMDPTTRMYYDADIIIFNTGHWWTHDKTSRGEYYYQEGNYVHPRLKVLKAFTRALTTWARWIDKNIDSKRTQVLFRGFSPVHFSGGQWNSGGQCNNEREPIFNDTYLEKYPSKMRALEYVIKTMKTPVLYMNISRLTDYRKDAHPSIYRMPYRTEAERNAAIMESQDCSHWCLPGVPDTWNELLYVSLLKYGKGTWKT